MADEACDLQPGAFRHDTRSSLKRKWAHPLASEKLGAPTISSSWSLNRKRMPSRACKKPFVAADEVLPESICPVCLNLGNEVWDSRYRFKHHLSSRVPEHVVDAREVSRTAERGCSGCQIVSWILEPYMAHLERPGNVIRLHFGHNCKTSSYRPVLGKHYTIDSCYRELNFNMGIVPTDPTLTNIFVKSTPSLSGKYVLKPSQNPSCPWRYLEHGQVITGPLSSLASVEKVKKWFSQCVSKHSACGQASKTPLPTRVVKIDGPADAKLYTSKDRVGVYACLSHCWGEKAIQVTTTENLERYSSKIPCENLPLAFQHAIEFAYYLGIQYLWIDSLCIIQDSIDDWRHEGSRMSKIYEDAAITLSTTGFVDSHQGCFAAANEPFASRRKTFTNRDHGTYEIHCHELLTQFETPLYTRGWVFQERILSRRIVHFMKTELWWECRESSDCECDNHEHHRSSFGHESKWAAILSGKPSPNRSIEESWKLLVSRYSSQSLTYASDVFPAIQTLAKTASPRMGRYMAGHWEISLPESLGWWVRGSARVEHKEWRAPSWSWAAVQEPIMWRWFARPVKTCASLVRVLTIPKGDDPMGQLSGGFIVIRGKVLALQKQESKDVDDHGLVPEGECFSLSDKWKVHWDTMRPCEVGQWVFVLKLSEYKDDQYTEQLWLILKAAEGKEGEYVRIGLLRICIRVYYRINHADKIALDAMNDRAVEREVKII